MDVLFLQIQYHVEQADMFIFQTDVQSGLCLFGHMVLFYFILFLEAWYKLQSSEKK